MCGRCDTVDIIRVAFLFNGRFGRAPTHPTVLFLFYQHLVVCDSGFNVLTLCGLCTYRSSG